MRLWRGRAGDRGAGRDRCAPNLSVRRRRGFVSRLCTSHITHQTLDIRRASGFTLIEAALTTVIVGTGVLAIVAAQQAYHKKNDWAQKVGTAVLLANELRELTLPLPMHDPLTGDATMGSEGNEASVADYDDLDDFAGAVSAGRGAGLTFDPPINALRQTIPDMIGWRQLVRVENVLPDDISSTFTQPLGTTDLMRVTVTVQHQSPRDPEPVTMTTLTWVVGKD